jgi:hypothetical protein
VAGGGAEAGDFGIDGIDAAGVRGFVLVMEQAAANRQFHMVTLTPSKEKR